MEETQETRIREPPPPPRVYQACFRCRDAKVKCDGERPTCSQCASRNEFCGYAKNRRIRGPGKSKSKIEALEERLAAVESLLPESSKTTGTTSVTPEQIQPNQHENSPAPSPAQQKGMTPPFDSISDRFTRWNEEECTKPLERISFSPLAAQEAEIWLLEKNVQDICIELPFLQNSWFGALLSKRQDALALAPSSWWQGLFNAIIASAVLFKSHNNYFHKIGAYGWVFFRNSYAVFPELVLQGESLSAAQAVMAMILFIRRSGDMRTMAILLSTAIRMLQVRTVQERVPTPVDEENQSRIFWATFTLDAEISLNAGVSPTHTSSELQPAPRLPPAPETVANADDVFRFRAELAQAQQRLAALLNSPTTQPSDFDFLEHELNQFRSRIPLEIRPSDNESPSMTMSKEIELPTLILHLHFFNALSMLSWAHVRLLTLQLLGSGATHEAIVTQTAHHKSLSRSSARSILTTLISSCPPKLPFTTLWTLLSYPLSASISLLAVICKEPTHPEAPSDILLLSRFVTFLDGQISENSCTDLRKLRDGIAQFEQVAKDAVDVALSAGFMPVNPSLWPLSLAGGKTGRALYLLLTCEAHQPMYLAQSLLSNVGNKGTENAKKLAEILGIEWVDDAKYGPFVPESLKPATYGFVFGSQGSG
ncbi:activator of stress genes 1 [Cladorrhinum sp. PSN259]|nr:activator of stress genes 1 [Cladorrhinum sp. PSN259]